MKIRKVCGICFSPVGNTKKTVELISAVIAKSLKVPVEYIDFTLPDARREQHSFGEDELAVFGTPTYAGRVPNKVMPFIQSLFSASGTPAISVVTFGNRNFDSSLTELSEELEKLGFSVFAAGAFASSHVFSDRIAAGRPDSADEEIIKAFALKAVEKLSSDAALQHVAIRNGEPVKPYYTPRKLNGEPAVFLKAKPVTDMSLCDKCGICAKVCPMGSINAEDTSNVTGICIKCQACVRKCPNGAKHFEDADFLSHVEMLEHNYTKRADSETFC